MDERLKNRGILILNFICDSMIKNEVIRMQDLSKTCKTLMMALNMNGAGLLFSKKQFMGIEGKPHTIYSISKAYWDDSKGKYMSTEIYKSTSLIRVVLYLRDTLYLEQGRELPMDNEMWNELRPEELRVLREESEDGCDV